MMLIIILFTEFTVLYNNEELHIITATLLVNFWSHPDTWYSEIRISVAE
jgi:hypothetical protein